MLSTCRMPTLRPVEKVHMYIYWRERIIFVGNVLIICFFISYGFSSPMYLLMTTWLIILHGGIWYESPE